MMHGVQNVKTSFIFHLFLFKEVVKDWKRVSDYLQSNDCHINKCMHGSPSLWQHFLNNEEILSFIREKSGSKEAPLLKATALKLKFFGELGRGACHLTYRVQ